MLNTYRSLVLVLLVGLCGFPREAAGQHGYNDPSITGRFIIFSEDFVDNANGWALGQFDGGKAVGKIESGQYVLQSNATGNNWQNWQTVVLNQEKDFEIEVRLWFVRGEDNNANCLFWGRDQQDFRHRFGISGNGQFVIDRFDGSWTNLVAWTPSPLVNTDGFNTLTVRKLGGTYHFFLNEQLVHSMPFVGFVGQQLGFQVNQNSTIVVDYVRVAYLNLSSAAAYGSFPPETRQVVFSENFDDNRMSWAVGTMGEGRRSGSIRDGLYHWQSLVTGDNSVVWQRVVIDEATDFEIEASIRFVRGEDNNANCLFWGRDDQDRRLRFGFSGNGQYLIDVFNERWSNFVGWTPSALVNKNGFNKLTVRKVGAEYFFFLNEQLVHVMPYHTFFGPYLGFQVTQNSLIAIDDLHVWRIFPHTANLPPEIVILEPDLTRGMKPARSLRVAGKAVDPDGIREVTVNGKRSTVDNSGNFAATVDPGGTENKITIRATDARGATAERSFSIGTSVPGTGSGGGEMGGRRIALLVGNGAYAHGGRLANPVNDVRAVKTALERLQFTVLKHENCTQAEMKKVMDDFGRRLKDYDVALFFYAGHGLQVNGHNYLIPVDATLESENDAEYDCVRADRVLAKMESGGTRTNIVILDACRDNPFERSWHRGARGSGLAFMNAPSGSLIAYSTSPGSTASDGSGANATYTAALLECVDTPGVTILQMFQQVRSLVISRTNNQQIPWESTSLRGDFFFRK